MTFSFDFSRLLRAIALRLRARPACSLTGVEPDWLVQCGRTPVPAQAQASLDDEIACRLARAL